MSKDWRIGRLGKYPDLNISNEIIVLKGNTKVKSEIIYCINTGFYEFPLWVSISSLFGGFCACMFRQGQRVFLPDKVRDGNTVVCVYWFD